MTMGGRAVTCRDRTETPFATRSPICIRSTRRSPAAMNASLRHWAPSVRPIRGVVDPSMSRRSEHRRVVVFRQVQ